MSTYKNGQQHNNYDFNDFDDTDDLSDDEVFLRDSRIAVDEDSSVSKPLMAPRRKVKTNKLHTEVRRLPPCRVICAPVCYGVIAFAALMGIICLVIFLVNTFSTRFGYGILPQNSVSHVNEVVGCTHMEVEDVWTQNFPKLLTESAIRMVDVNSDSTPDVVLGFATGVDGYNIPDFVCDIYFDGNHPCFGGVMALDGKTGKEIWRHYMDHEVFALNCNEDLNGDDVQDCLAGGRAGTFQAVNGKDGNMLWNFGPQPAKNDIMNLYTAQFIPDQNADGIIDVLAVHGGDPLAEPGSKHRLSGRILILSGKDGNVLRWVGVPDDRESYYSPQLLIHPDGTQLVLFGTGGETHSGGLWYITLDALIKGNMDKAVEIYHDDHKGVMTPPVLVDVTGDEVEDIVIAMFNSTAVVFDGLNFKQVWNFSIPSSESYSTPAAGYFNNDNIPDIFIKYQIGPGFPIYYYSQSTVLDGLTGQPLLKPVQDTVGAQASAVTLSIEGTGNDIFLYWTSDCFGHEGASQEFTFVEGTNVHEQSRSDFCKLRFNSRLISRMYALSNNWNSPGFIVYDSDARKTLEYNNTLNTSAIAIEYVRTHPDVLELYRHYDGDELDVDGSIPQGTRPKGRHRPNSGSNRGKGKSYANRKGDNVRLDETDYERGPFSNNEYEEDVHYPKVHNVRKHGHYKAKYDMMHDDGSAGEQQQRGRPDLNYPDAFSQEYDSQSLPDRDMLEDPAWSRGRNRDRQWYNQYGANNDDDSYSDSRRYHTGHHGSQRYTNYYDQGRKDYAGSGRQFSDDDPDVDWKVDTGYGKHSRFRDRKQRVNKRKRRHIGPHDDDGIQRLISTGTLAPILDSSVPDANHTMDLVFATYWFFPAKTQAILPEDRDCIQRMLGKEPERFLPGNRYYGLDHDAFEETITKECLQQSGREPTENRTYQSQSDYDPFNVHMGQMTVYRLKLRCTCKGDPRVERAKRTCAKILPYDQQGWAAYMGMNADSHYGRRTTK